MGFIDKYKSGYHQSYPILEMILQTSRIRIIIIILLG
ncbi:hypothetical protein [Escherichia coli]|nr:hypothetical protein [Escherichia coli]